MFSTARRRFTFLAITTFLALCCTLFTCFLPEPQWQMHSIINDYPENINNVKISSFRHGSLLTSHEPLFSNNRYERYLSSPFRLLLNLKTEDQRNKLMRNAADSPLRMNDKTLSSIMRMDNSGQLQVTALWVGRIVTQSCSSKGQCYFIGSSPFDYDNSVWYSPDGGINWQQLTSWNFPQNENVNNSSKWTLIKTDKNGRIWLADEFTLYASDNLGNTWEKIADIRPLLEKNSISHFDNEKDSLLSKFSWIIDNQQRYFVDMEILARYEDGLRERRFLYLLNKNLQEKTLAIDIHNVTLSPQGELFFTMRSGNYDRYGLYRLDNNDTPEQILEHIDWLSSLRIGLNHWLIGKGSGYSYHLYLSSDKGKQWHRISQLPDGAIFDSWHDRVIRFPLYGKSDIYWTTSYQ